ncbi:DUF4143 domain-containing protein, partial [Candidatus Saccharibacteria bacterium]|nr:ATP-binding protein [Candidatus Saccharibacteria bacterium]NIV03250.1 DUF4143 domain-containing protein [Calditrichia bacterium]NIV71408.1 DUF4143 domain-containing protein [Calditrichia bacterium]NIV97923.1 DUF4143 domain-containing protein [Candidatus Saccharibacteria bacterium]NIW78224.1 DUF4143 domain-containing protein [Calditrichia bacterium]
RDIARRYNIRKIEVLQKLALYLIYNMGMGLNISRMAELVGSNRTTILELLAHLKEVYLIFTSSSFSFSPNERMNTTRPKKVYCVDNGFFAAIKTKGSKDFAKKIKNAVYQQLRFRWGAEIFYWKNKIEIDFVLEDGFPIGIVVDKMDTDKEIYRLFYYMNQHNLNKGLLISWNKLQIMEENERKILILPLWLFLTKSQEDVMNYYEAG